MGHESSRQTPMKPHLKLLGFRIRRPRIGRYVQKAYITSNRLVLKLSGGRLWNTFHGSEMLVLTTIGRRTQQHRDQILVTVRVGEGFAVCGANAGRDQDPAWALNLRAEPSAFVTPTAGPARGVKQQVLARELTGAERDEVTAAFVAAYAGYAEYQKKTDRRLPIFVLAPVVEG